MASEPITIENKVPRCTAFVPARQGGEPLHVQVQIDDHNVLFAQGRDWDKARDAACVQIVYLVEALNGLLTQLRLLRACPTRPAVPISRMSSR